MSTTRPSGVDVGEQFLAGQLIARVDDGGQSWVADPDPESLADLARNSNATVDPDMVVPQRGQPEGLDLPGVLLVADPHRRLVHQPQDGGEDLLERKPWAVEVLVDPLSQGGEHLPEGADAVELGAVLNLPPSPVIAVLLAPAGVAAGRLDVSVGQWADPDLPPRRRGPDRVDPARPSGPVTTPSSARR